MQRIDDSAANGVTHQPARPADPRDRQDVGHRGDEAPDFGQDYGNAPEIERPAEPTRQQPRPPGRPAAFGASSGETWGHGA